MGNNNQTNRKKALRIIIPVVIFCMIAGIWIFKNHEVVGLLHYDNDSYHTGSLDYTGSSVDNSIEIKIISAGCPRCKTLEKNVKAVVEEIELDIIVTKITNINEFLKDGILLPPVLIINGKVKTHGKVPGKDEIIQFIRDAM